jgi:hypothetical protein
MYTKILLMILTFWLGCSASFAGGDDEKPAGPRNKVEEPNLRKQAHDAEMEEEVQEINPISNANMMEEEPRNPEDVIRRIVIIREHGETSFEKELRDTLRVVKNDLPPGEEGSIDENQSLTRIVVYDGMSYGFFGKNSWSIGITFQSIAKIEKQSQHSVKVAYTDDLAYQMIAHAYLENSKIKEIDADTFCNLIELSISGNSNWLNARNTNFLSKFNLGKMKRLCLGAPGLVSAEVERNLSKINPENPVIVFLKEGSFRGEFPLLSSRKFKHVTNRSMVRMRLPEFASNVQSRDSYKNLSIFDWNCFAAQSIKNDREQWSEI